MIPYLSSLVASSFKNGNTIYSSIEIEDNIVEIEQMQGIVHSNFDYFYGFFGRIINPRTLQGKEKTGVGIIHESVNWMVEDGKVKEFQPKFKDGNTK